MARPGTLQARNSNESTMDLAENVGENDVSVSNIDINELLSVPTGPSAQPTTNAEPTVSATDIASPREFQSLPVDASNDDIMQTINSIVSGIGEEPEAESRIRDIEDQQLQLLQQLEGQTADEAQLRDALGVSRFEQEMSDLSSDIRLKSASLRQGLVNEEGRPIPMEFITGRQAQMKRLAAAELEGLQAAFETARGNVLTAESRIDRALSLKYNPIEARINTLSSLLDVNYDRLNRSEKRRADQRSAELSVLQNRLQEQRQEEQEAKNLVLQAIQNGANPQAAARLMQQDGLTTNEVLSSNIAGNLRDPLQASQLETQRLQQQQLRLENEQIQNEINDIGLDGFINAEQAASLDPQTLKQMAVAKAQTLGSAGEREGAVEAISTFETGQDIIDALTGDDAITTGPLAGRFRQGLSLPFGLGSTGGGRALGLTSQEEDRLNSLMTVFTARFIKAISGAQVSDKEREFLMGALPDENKQEQANIEGIKAIGDFLSTRYTPTLGIDLSPLTPTDVTENEREIFDSVINE